MTPTSGDQPQLEAQATGAPPLAALGRTGGAIGRALEERVATPATPAAHEQRGQPVRGKVRNAVLYLIALVQHADDGTDGHVQDQVRAVATVAFVGTAGRARLRAEEALAAETVEGVDPLIGTAEDLAPAPAVATVRPAEQHELLAPERDAPRSPVAALDLEDYLVEHKCSLRMFHSSSYEITQELGGQIEIVVVVVGQWAFRKAWVGAPARGWGEKRPHRRALLLGTNRGGVVGRASRVGQALHLGHRLSTKVCSCPRRGAAYPPITRREARSGEV